MRWDSWSLEMLLLMKNQFEGWSTYTHRWANNSSFHVSSDQQSTVCVFAWEEKRHSTTQGPLMTPPSTTACVTGSLMKLCRGHWWLSPHHLKSVHRTWLSGKHFPLPVYFFLLLPLPRFTLLHCINVGRRLNRQNTKLFPSRIISLSINHISLCLQHLTVSVRPAFWWFCALKLFLLANRRNHWWHNGNRNREVHFFLHCSSMGEVTWG